MKDYATLRELAQGPQEYTPLGREVIDVLDERDRLAAEVVALREALEPFVMGCTTEQLMPDPSPAVAEIERLVAVGRTCTGMHYTHKIEERGPLVLDEELLR